MIGHINGYIKIVSIQALKVTSVYRLNLEEGETLTCGVYSPSGHNFAIGTSYGSIYLGLTKKDPMSNTAKWNMFAARIDRITNGQDTAVTSIQLTSFHPQGCILAAFDNGHVRCWHSTIKPEVQQKLLEKAQHQTKKSKRQPAYELSELGETQFDVVDKFDMFDNPHGIEDFTEQEAENLLEEYGVSSIQPDMDSNLKLLI